MTDLSANSDGARAKGQLLTVRSLFFLSHESSPPYYHNLIFVFPSTQGLTKSPAFRCREKRLPLRSRYLPSALWIPRWSSTF